MLKGQYVRYTTAASPTNKAHVRNGLGFISSNESKYFFLSSIKGIISSDESSKFLGLFAE